MRRKRVAAGGGRVGSGERPVAGIRALALGLLALAGCLVTQNPDVVARENPTYILETSPLDFSIVPQHSEGDICPEGTMRFGFTLSDADIGQLLYYDLRVNGRSVLFEDQLGVVLPFQGAVRRPAFPCVSKRLLLQACSRVELYASSREEVLRVGGPPRRDADLARHVWHVLGPAPDFSDANHVDCRLTYDGGL